MKIYTNEVMLNNGVKVESFEYEWLDMEEIAMLAKKLEDDCAMQVVAEGLGFRDVLNESSDDWRYVEGGFYELGEYVVTGQLNCLHTMLEDNCLNAYFDYESFGRAWSNGHYPIETEDGIVFKL